MNLLRDRKGHYDVFLVDAAGDVVYTAAKEDEFANNLFAGRWSNRELARTIEGAASDRPYKPAKTLSESITIMGFVKKDQHTDPKICDLFLTSGVYKEYAERYLLPEQLDEVDISKFVPA